jgi:hypothetical protein
LGAAARRKEVTRRFNLSAGHFSDILKSSFMCYPRFLRTRVGKAQYQNIHFYSGWRIGGRLEYRSSSRSPFREKDCIEALVELLFSLLM